MSINELKMDRTVSEEKLSIIDAYRNHVSPGKVEFYKKYKMDFVMGKRKGPWLYDIEGQKRLFNLHCNGGVFNLGHRNSELIEVLKSGLDELDIGNHHLLSKERAELAQYLANLMPGDLDYTVFGVSGGEAIDLALKVARAHTGKSKIISAHGGYHGHTGLAMAAGDSKYRDIFGPQSPGFKQVPFGNIKALSRAIDRKTAAVILETVPATLGMVIPSIEYMQAVRELCDSKQVLLILDEVQTGLGRTGKMWAFEHYDIVPDIVVLGKGLSGGIYPISATVMRKSIEEVFHEDPFIHISTFGGAELGCSVAKKVLEISSEPSFLAHVNELSGLFDEGVEKIAKKYPKFLKGLRRLGLMMGLEMKDNWSGPLLTKTAYDHDLLIVYANNDPSIGQFLPPLTMETGEVGWVLEQLEKSVVAAKKLKPMYKLKTRFDRVMNIFK